MQHGHDHVDRILEEWAAEWPGLDMSPQGIVGRISRLSRFLERGLVTTFEKFRLNGGEFDVLATLRRRAGTEEAMSPTSLADALMLSSAAMTNRIDRLVEAGLVTRERDEADRRAVWVRLSDPGRQLIDRALVEHAATEAELIDALTPTEQKTLAKLLRKLLVPIENGQPEVVGKHAR
jgi:DNA-binding MarR family transcriptional regulator